VELDVDNAPLGTVSDGANRADLQPGDDARSLCRDSMVHGAGPCTPGHIALGNTVPTLGFPCAMGLGVAALLLSRTPDSPPRPVNWGQVEDRMEQACSQVDEDILHPI
jgi:hypothetical protein